MAPAKMRISYPHVTKTPGVCGGKACIDGTRVRVNNVVFLGFPADAQGSVES